MVPREPLSSQRTFEQASKRLAFAHNHYLPVRHSAAKLSQVQQSKTQLIDYSINFVQQDEAVILFRVKAGGMANLHNGQDARVNVHMCLLNCNESTLIVAGDAHRYTAGHLVAFEDRAMHEILNAGEQDRILLAVAVLHPDLERTGSDPPSPRSILSYAIDGNARRFWRNWQE